MQVYTDIAAIQFDHRLPPITATCHLLGPHFHVTPVWHRCKLFASQTTDYVHILLMGSVAAFTSVYRSCPSLTQAANECHPIQNLAGAIAVRAYVPTSAG